MFAQSRFDVFTSRRFAVYMSQISRTYTTHYFHLPCPFRNLDLRPIQNSLALAVTRTPRHHHITPILKSPHWLKIPERINFKVLSLTYNSLEYSQPTYIVAL